MSDVTIQQVNLAEDPEGSFFRYAPLDGEIFASTVSEEIRSRLPDSIVVVAGENDLLTRSSALVRILERLGGIWRVLGWLLALVPRPGRDLGYDAVARVRLRLFRRPLDICPLMPGHYRRRWL